MIGGNDRDRTQKWTHLGKGECDDAKVDTGQMHGRRQLQDIPLQMSSRQFKELVGSSSEHLELIHQYVETTKFMKNIKDQIQFNKNLLSSYYI